MDQKRRRVVVGRGLDGVERRLLPGPQFRESGGRSHLQRELRGREAGRG